jgi:hypothetical protein
MKLESFKDLIAGKIHQTLNKKVALPKNLQFFITHEYFIWLRKFSFVFKFTI